MCGISGTTKDTATFAVDSIASSMRHRGPDASGAFLDEQVNLFQSRLAIIDLDPRSEQPFWSADRKVAVVFNGEIYNYQKLKEELKSGYSFSTTSDTEVLLAGYLAWGAGVWERLEGMFAVSILDTRSNTIVLAKDHAGIKPLWYSTAGGVLSWASELKTLFTLDRSLGGEGQIDEDALRLYFMFGYIPSPRTLYKNVRQLEKSSYLEYDLKAKTSSIKYFSPQKDESDRSLSELVDEAVMSHMVADVPVGLFFSGGTDSSLLAAVLKKHGQTLQTYSLKMPGRDVDFEYSTKIGKHLGLDVQFHEYGAEAFKESYEDVVHTIDTPLADIAVFPNSFISKQAAKDVKVVLSGEGGDELFFGYRRHLQLRKHTSSTIVQKLAALYLSAPQHPYKGYLYQKYAAAADPVGYYLVTCSPGFRLWDSSAVREARGLLEEVSDPLYYDRDLYLENMLLRKLDFSTMRYSLEGRVPLLASSLFQASATARKSFMSQHSDMLKPALKDVLAGLIPRELVDRPKSGFGYRPDQFVSEECVHDDFEAALVFLRKFNLHVPASHEDAMRRMPGVILPIILLHRSVINAVS